MSGADDHTGTVAADHTNTGAADGTDLDGRRAAVAAALRSTGATALLVTDIHNVGYLTGFRGSSGVVLLEADGHTVLATDSRYELQVAAQAPGVVHVITRDYVGGALSARRGEPTGAVAVEADDVTLGALPGLERALSAAGTPTDVVHTSGLVEGARRAKDAAELATITRACGIVDTAWTALVDEGRIAAGRTERQVAGDLEHAMRLAGSDGVAFETIVASGPNGALPHHDASDRVLTTGDLVVVDFGAFKDGYASDCTRTVAVGGLSDELRAVHALVLRAQRAGVEAIRPGLGCAELDAVSRGLIDAAGHGAHFGHSLGHGVGRDVHEAPAISSKATGTLADGDVVTVEPGIYLPGRGGVRIEDTVAVTSTGHRVLTTTSKDLLVL